MSIADDLIRQRIEINRKIEKINRIIACSPHERLICRKRDHVFRYAYIAEGRGKDNKGKEKYLSKTDPLLLELAKRDYYKQYLADLQRELKAINGYLKWHSENPRTQIYMDKHPGIREILLPALIDQKNRFYNWANAFYERNGKHPENLIFITDGGFYVRSKAEQMIANMYLESGIPFRYEDPVYLPDGNIIYPDFHLYAIRDYKEWYHEHNGQMLKDQYYNKYEFSLRQLRAAGIIPGVNLLQTFEAEGYPLDPGCIRDIINRYLV